MKPKSLQTSVSKRGARAESVLVSLLVLWSFHRCSQKERGNRSIGGGEDGNWQLTAALSFSFDLT